MRLRLRERETYYRMDGIIREDGERWQERWTGIRWLQSDWRINYGWLTGGGGMWESKEGTSESRKREKGICIDDGHAGSISSDEQQHVHIKWVDHTQSLTGANRRSLPTPPIPDTRDSVGTRLGLSLMGFVHSLIKSIRKSLEAGWELVPLSRRTGIINDQRTVATRHNHNTNAKNLSEKRRTLLTQPQFL